MIESLEFLYNGGRTKRFHCFDMNAPQNVAEHSFYVAGLCLLMYSEGEVENARLGKLIAAAVVHDLAEHKTGDVQSPAKRRNPELKEILDNLEDDYLKESDLFIQLGIEDKRRLKMADNLDGLMTCVRERRLGNQSVEEIYVNYRANVTKLNPEGKEREIFFAIMNMWEDSI